MKSPVSNGILLTLIALVLLAAMSTAHAEDMRGAWVTAWTSGFYTPEEADATIAAAKAANLNTLFIQVRKVADAYYESTIEPRGSEIAPGYDPLAYTIEKAHAQGVQVHAWVNVFRVWREKEWPANPNHLVNQHRDWLNKTYKGETYASEGVYLDPGIPEAREYITQVIEDIANRYNVDGIHLDYIRYPGNEWGYSSTALLRYYSETGEKTKPKPTDAKWLDWRRDQVTILLRQIRTKVTAVKPQAKITAATIPWGDCPDSFSNSAPYTKVCQDWRQWLCEGLLDANIPMNYRVESKPKMAQQFRIWLDGFSRWSGGRPVFVGIDVSTNEPKHVIQQIEAVRKANLQGFVMFSFNASARRDALVNALKSSNCSAVAPAKGTNKVL